VIWAFRYLVLAMCVYLATLSAITHNFLGTLGWIEAVIMQWQWIVEKMRRP
jgi:hypothetical protein